MHLYRLKRDIQVYSQRALVDGGVCVLFFNAWYMTATALPADTRLVNRTLLEGFYDGGVHIFF